MASASTYVEGIRHGHVGPNDHGAVLNIVAWFLMVVMILAVLLRLLIRFTTAHVPGLDDAVLSLAGLFAIAQVIAISSGVNSGLGKRSNLLSPHQISSLSKDVYVATILYVFTLALAKASTLLLIGRLANVKLHLTITRILGLIVALWLIVAAFGTAFQCPLPSPWDVTNPKCMNIPVFWDVMGTIDILTDLALVALPARIVWDLQMDWEKKVVVVSAFAFRVLVCAAQIAHVVFLTRVSDNKSDLTYDANAYLIAVLCQTMLTVIVACIPALKPFMDRAASGMMGVSLGKRAGTYGVQGSYAMQSMSKHSKNGHNGNVSESRELPRGALRPDKADHQTSIISTKRRPTGETPQDEQYMIQRTIDWDVQYSDERAASANHQRPSAEDGKDSSGSRSVHEAV